MIYSQFIINAANSTLWDMCMIYVGGPTYLFGPLAHVMFLCLIQYVDEGKSVFFFFLYSKRLNGTMSSVSLCTFCVTNVKNRKTVYFNYVISVI